MPIRKKKSLKKKTKYKHTPSLDAEKVIDQITFFVFHLPRANRMK